VTLTSSIATGNQWYLNGNPIGGAANQGYIATASGDYTDTVTTSGCTTAPSAPTTVTVSTTPPPVVTTNADSGAGSLRQAIIDACPGSIITFNMNQVTSPITLTSAELLIDKDLAIQGPGANLLTVKRGTAGTPNFRILHVTVANPGVVNVSGLTISNADVGSDDGGGIRHNGTGTVNLINSALSQNSAGAGGGISNNSTGTVNITNSTLSSNSSSGMGGGINNNSTGTVNIIVSTLTNNSGAGGGGINNDNTGAINLFNCTVVDNSALVTSGGGIRNVTTGSVQPRNSIIALNTGPTGPDLSGAFSSQGCNLIGKNDGSTGFLNGSNCDRVGSNASPLDPLLGPLQNNGGPTQTRAPLPASPALNGGSNGLLPADTFDLDDDSNTAEPIPFDQRGPGFARIINGNVDKGAVEVDYAINSTAGTQQSATINSAFATQLQVTVKESNVGRNGIPVTFTAPVGGASGTFPGGVSEATVNTDGSGVATAPMFTANGEAGGPYQVFASLSTAFGTGLPTASFLLTNARAATATSVSSSSNASGLGLSVTFTATVTSNAGTPPGTVQFSDNGINLGVPQTLNASGVATIATSALTVGTHTITASYNSPSNGAYFLASTGTLAPDQQVNCPTLGLVTNSNDSGAGSLRQTIADACPGSTITFAANLAGPITLTSSELLLNKSLRFQGPGANLLTIQRSAAVGTPLFSIFSIFDPSVTTNISGLTLSNADSSANGGAIRNSGTLTVSGVTFSGNHTSAGGAAILNGSAGTVTLSNSTLSNNRSDIWAAIYNQGGTFTITNSTFAGNTNQQNYPGAAVFSGSNSVTNVTNCTLSQNTGLGGAVFQNGGATGKVNLKNSIVSGNNGGDTSGITNLGNNLIGGTALLAALSNYGGPTQTMALLPGSPAINAGTSTGAPATDQRGINRVGAVDIGAFESGGFSISATSGTPQSATDNIVFGSPLVATVSSGSGEPIAGGVVTFAAPGSGASGVFPGNVTTVNITTDASGVVTAPTFTANGTAGGPYNVTAGGRGIASSATFSLTNNKAATTTGITSSVNPSDFGQNVIFTATVTSAIGTPTGTVQFTTNGNNLDSPQVLNAGGVATLATSALSVGPQVIGALYSGANFESSTATLSGSQVVKGQPSLTINDVSIMEGDSGTTIAVFTVTLSATSNLTVTVNYATANGTANARTDYTATNSTLTFNPGETTKTISVSVNGDQSFEPDETFFLNLSGAINATITDNQGLGTILNDDAQGGIISFSSGNYTVAENQRAVTITVNRTGDTSAAATVDYATSDDSDPAKFVPCATINGIASSRCDFTGTSGTLKFSAGETTKTFQVLISEDSYVENSETFPVTLSNLTGGAVFATPSTATVTIIDDVPEPATNPIDDADNFAREQYHDFLNREGDQQGQDYWTARITVCGSDAACIQQQRIGVSGQFFIEQEFQQTGFYVYRIYKAGLGRRPSYLEFTPDRSRLLANSSLDAEKIAYSLEFVQRSEFTGKYPLTSNGPAFVDALLQNVQTNSGVDLIERREELLAVYHTGSDQTDSRARTLRTLADHDDFKAAEYNRAFVLAQYFGFLRREPDPAGYTFWLSVLNGNSNNVRNMVCMFITSDEYQGRFGVARQHSNAECKSSSIAEAAAP
jgi:hypothetical protein